MALNNLVSRRDTILLPNGSPNAGGLIDIFEPNTAVRIATFKDPDLTEQNANPVVLDGAGKASIWFSPNADMDIRTRPSVAIPLGTIYVSEQGVNPDALGSGSASGLVPNGSFEIDTDADNTPDGWTLTDETGSNNFLDTLNSTDGLQSMRFESTGSGGGNIVTQDFFVVNDIDDLSVQFDLFSSVANVRNIVRVEWFDVSQVPISNSDVYDDSATNPVVFTSQQTAATPPAGARFAKLRIIGCDPSIATVGSTNFDRFNVFYPLTVSGAFDNLLLAGNTISSTNTDGNIILLPNGDGLVLVQSDVLDVSDFPVADVDTALRVRNSIGGAEFRTFNATGNFGILQSDAAGIFEATWMAFTRNSGVQTNFNDLRAFNSAAFGIQVLDTSGASPGVEFLNDAIVRVGLIQHVGGATGLIFRNALAGAGSVRLQGRNVGDSADNTVFLGNPDGASSFFNVGVEVGRTVTAANGGLQANNALTGAGFERVLTTSDVTPAVQGKVKENTTASAVSSTTLVDDPELAGFVLQPSTSYIVEGVLSFQGNGATGNGFRMAFDFNGQIGNIEEFNGSNFSYEASGALESIFTRGVGGGTLLIKPTFDNAGNRELVVFKFGLVTQSDFVADTELDLQWAQGTSFVTATDLEQGASFMTVTEIANP